VVPSHLDLDTCTLKISVFGLGYVGAVSCGCLPQLGHSVVGVDISPLKVQMISAGQSPVVEDRIDELISEAVKAGRLRATADLAEAVRETDVSLVSVATPSNPDYSPNLHAVEQVVRDIGLAVRNKGTPHVVVLRSTVPPGTTRARLLPILEEASGRRVGEGISLVFNPEFLREGSSVKDFHQPPQTIIGSFDEAGALAMEQMYQGLPGAFVRTTPEVAEAVKYLCNVFHALKIVFANETGSVLKSYGLDAREVLGIFCQDTQLNISAAYMRPGFAFGGSCLPKEVKGFITLARAHDVQIPALGALLESNDQHVRRAYEQIARDGRKRVALFGLAFKPGTDDMRDSPLVTLAERLLGKGFELAIYDRFVKISRLLGKNKDFIEREIPHLERLLQQDVEAAVRQAEVIVVGHAEPATRAAIVAHAEGRRVIDLAGYADLRAASAYEGICW
jgi:GDP-mannose 6-dehydrogenase